ncbi:MAG: porin family protein [Pseudomonadota bacterium]|nr:porin family protein [Pseudomonadota bacterium]
MTSKTLAVATLALLCATGVQAQTAATQGTGVYTELGYSFLRFKDGNTGGLKSFKGNGGMLRGIVGYNAHENLAVEGMVGLGVSGKKSRLGEDFYSAKPKNMFGVFVKPKVALGDSAELYGRLGYASAKFDGDDKRRNGVAWGLGAAYRFTPELSITADYMRYHSKNSAALDGLTLGVNYRF